MGAIAAKSIEQSLELKNRIERALAYADSAPANSAHARNMARILDGSITLDDELNEIDEQTLPAPRRMTALPARQMPTGPRGKLKPGKGLAGRNTAQRLEIREWIAEQGFDVAPSGRIPQRFLDLYDQAMEEARKLRKAQRDGAAESRQDAFPIAQ